jgi:hypothetical protein
MRFVSRWGRFSIQLRPIIQEAYATGMAKILQDPIYARFAPDRLTHIDRETAMKTWSNWNGSYQEMDEVSTVPPDYRIGVYDTDEAAAQNGWDEETKKFVDESLVEYSVRYEDIAIVPKTLLDPPWPNYDQFKGSVPALMRKLVEEGHDLQAVLDYENAVQGRGKIVGAIEELMNDPDAQEALGVGQEEEVVA